MEFDTEDQLASAGEEKAVGGKKRKSESGKSVASDGKKKKAKVESAGKSKVSALRSISRKGGDGTGRESR